MNPLPRSISGLQVPSDATRIEPYESKLDREGEWAMSEASRFFRGESGVQRALQKITGKLHDRGIDYAVVGAMAMLKYGYRRFTEDVALLVTREGLKEIHRNLEGLGYVPVFAGSKNLRDVENGVKVEFLVTGEFPGDGKPKPVAFPNPSLVANEIDGVRYVDLPVLVEMKLASGMTSPERMKDLADVIELVKVINLPATFGNALSPFVHEKYTQLWNAAHPPAKRYAILWRNKISDAKSLDEMIERLQSRDETFRSVLADGVIVDGERSKLGVYAYLVTTDPVVAEKYDMHDESAFLRADDAEDDPELRPGP